MNIGFDAKRAYHNCTGLGNYSRTLISALSQYHPENQYFLFNPKQGELFKPIEKNIKEILPAVPVHKLFRSAWRSKWVKHDLQKNNIDIYHGLSHEIPMGISKTRIRTVVTIHDLIQLRYPEQYKPIDVRIYNAKTRYACTHADKIIAVSEQTKKDIIHYYKIPEDKISVCYQSCNCLFDSVVNQSEKELLKEKYGLPAQYFLYVGSVIERKNLLSICKAMLLLKDELDIPLVVIGEGGKYKEQVRSYLKQNNIEHKLIFLSETAASGSSAAYKCSSDFPAIYQSATALIYPSFFEGFGIPVLEALYSRLPVITSNVSSLTEIAGGHAYYVDPASAAEIAAAMKDICFNQSCAGTRAAQGYEHAKKFAQKNCADAVMELYKML